MIETLFPDEVVVVTAQPAMWDGVLFPEEAAAIAAAVRSRQREFTAGRLCARAALARLGIDRYPLRVGANREPLWPPGVVGSIAHAADHCAAVACRSGRIIGLGLDIERGDRLPAELVPTICTPAEIAWCDRRRSSCGDWTKLIFSAKEAVYKCLFPATGAFLEFHDVAIEPDPDRSRFATILLKPIRTMPQSCAIDGRFARDGGMIMTSAMLVSSSHRVG